MAQPQPEQQERQQQRDPSTCELVRLLGWDLAQRHNVAVLDGGDTAALAAGGAALLLHLPSNSQRTLPARPGGAVAAVAAHPSGACLAVAEACAERAPDILIHAWPSLELLATLSGGAERGYSALAFDPAGGTLASVACAPDYTLTLWDWRRGGLLLRARAFGADVHRVAFSPRDPGRLVTAGAGHIRFWRMAATFTGRKLQGALGKFGAVELSDVSAWVELPSGKVLSGSECGSLLLWDDALVKAVVTRPGGAPCHDGAVEALMLDEASGTVFSGGADGVLRLWRVDAFDEAPESGTSLAAGAPDSSRGGPGGSSSGRSAGCSSSGERAGGGEGSDSIPVTPTACPAAPAIGGCAVHEVPSTPLCEVVLPSGSRVRCLVPLSSRVWLVVDAAGGLLCVSVPSDTTDPGGYSVMRLLACTAGAIAGLVALPGCPIAVTASADGVVCARDYMAGTLLQARRFGAPATCMAMLPPPEGCAGAGSGACRLAVGFGDGSVRIVQRCSDGWALLAALKPHAAAVAVVAVASCGTRAATVAADGTVFFFSTAGKGSGAGGAGTSSGSSSSVQWTPLGFCALMSSDTCGSGGSGGGSSAACTPTCADWTGDGGFLVVGCAGGELVEVQAPAGTADTARSYALQLPMRKAHCVTGLRMPGRAQAPMLQLLGEGGTGHSAMPVGELHRLSITWLRCATAPGSGRQVLVCLCGAGAGHVWACSLDGATLVPAGPAVSAPAATTAACGSASGQFQLWGAADGSVRLQAAGSDERAASAYWQGTLHHPQCGGVTAVAMAWDDSCFLSGAADGSLVVVTNHLAAAATAAAASRQAVRGAAEVGALLPPLVSLSGCEVQDLAPGAPSLEQEKAAAAADAVASEAAGARAALSAQVGALRAELAQLIAANEAAPPGRQLPHVLFRVDPGLDALLATEHAAKLQEARCQAAWDAAAAATLLNKLANFFATQLAAGTLTVAPLGGSGAAVGGLGLPELPPEVQAEIDTTATTVTVEPSGATIMSSRGGAARTRRTPGASVVINPGSTAGDGVDGGAAGSGGGSADSRVNMRAAERATARREREAAWAALMRCKPGADYESVEDAAALAEAAATVGDLKLRGTPGFIPDQEHRQTPATKGMQMARRAAAMAAARDAFDASLRGLHAERAGLLRRLAGAHARAADICHQLGLPAATLAGMHAGEEASAAPITCVSKAELETHAALKLAEHQRKAGGLGWFADTGSLGGRTGGRDSVMAAPMMGAAASLGPAQGALPIGHSSLQRRWLQVELQALQARSHAAVAAFDAVLAAKARERRTLECDMAASTARQLVAYQELLVLKDCEQHELALGARLGAKQEEADELDGRAVELEGQVELKRDEGDSVAAARAAVVAEFEAYVADKAPHVEALTAIFHRRIKRARRRGGATGVAGSDAGTDSGSAFTDSDGGMSASDDDDEDDDGPEVCPPGCEQPVYDRVVELRDARLDEEGAAADVARALEGLRKDLDLLARKRRIVDAALAAINQDVLAFQRDKQGTLNLVEVEVALRSHQLNARAAAASSGSANDGWATAPAPPPAGAALSSTLVISRAALDTLEARMQDLDFEKAVLRTAQKHLRRQHATLQAEGAALADALAEQKARCRDVQLLKFGREIDVSLLETVGRRNAAADELRAALQEQERAQQRELAAVGAMEAARSRELLVVTRANTAALNAVSDLTAAQRAAEAALAAQRSGVFSDGLDALRAALAERHALVEGVNQRASTLQQLHARIAMLRRKDGVLAV